MQYLSCLILAIAIILSVVCTATSASSCECGLEGSVGRIYNGSKVKGNKYPWLAHIMSYRLNIFVQCAGSLIDEQHVATAAHCTFDDNGDRFKPSDIEVYLGLSKAFSESSEPESVSEVWVDPSYNRDNLSHDFAILTLSKPVKFTKTIAPVCLPNSEDGLAKLTVSGWGITSAGAEASDDLLEVDVDYLTLDECDAIKKTYFLEKLGIPSYMEDSFKLEKNVDTHMCAINKQSKGGACSGDSGGPLMHQGSNGRYYLMGVTSGSWTECGQASETAGLFTRTVYYKDIIQSISNNSCWQDL